jgi:hypothetical protein
MYRGRLKVHHAEICNKFGRSLLEGKAGPLSIIKNETKYITTTVSKVIIFKAGQSDSSTEYW